MMKKIAFYLFLSLFFVKTYSQDYKVMTYNIRYDNSWDTINHWKLRKEKIIEQISFYKPDILGIQEALHQPTIFLRNKLTGYGFVGVGREDGKTKGEYAPIFYNKTKWKLLKQDTFWLSKTPSKVSIGWDAALERICTYVLLQEKKTGKKIWVFNTHFDHQGAVARKESAKLLVNKINRLNTEKYPLILMGDFNSIPYSDPIRELSSHLDWKLRDNPELLFGPPATYNDFNTTKIPNVWIDYIFTKFLTIYSYAHLDNRLNNTRYISDHFPVYATFSF